MKHSATYIGGSKGVQLNGELSFRQLSFKTGAGGGPIDSAELVLGCFHLPDVGHNVVVVRHYQQHFTTTIGDSSSRRKAVRLIYDGCSCLHDDVVTRASCHHMRFVPFGANWRLTFRAWRDVVGLWRLATAVQIRCKMPEELLLTNTWIYKLLS